MNEAAPAQPSASTLRPGQPWRGGEPPPLQPVLGVTGTLRAVLRGVAILLVLLLGVAALLLLRLVERPFAGPRRPLSGPLVQGVCRLCLAILGLRWRRVGKPMNAPGAAVANHTGWLDIFVLNAAMPVFFVSKAEVAGWPGINLLTRVTDTHFVVRDPRLARAQAAEFAARTRAGHRLLFFPEGTSTDGRRVLPFKPTLFQGFFDPALPAGLALQPVSVRYEAPPVRDPRFYGWWGDMELRPHLLAVLAQAPQGSVTVTLHEPVPVAGHDRKSLAAACERAVRTGGPG
ncbi:1-acyl-sn-glycerol-3-phosphate acyltransferase [Paracoccus sp. S-4012]|uniref:lysophospholipid acyltransferase family protein n=1 Tax=Paracoccus sp. S-4012 TaxID=2665648 RepID=UPI0012AEFA29|nr:lysophospholipid acyltransferase family protein [Paracoccus sp. S-4012]MRX50097.1 1-acyl-sn-glycerol-3-phosphate acyltransferase [Paracoccus sp. S-4012]